MRADLKFAAGIAACCLVGALAVILVAVVVKALA